MKSEEKKKVFLNDLAELLTKHDIKSVCIIYLIDGLVNNTCVYKEINSTSDEVKLCNLVSDTLDNIFLNKNIK